MDRNEADFNGPDRVQGPMHSSHTHPIACLLCFRLLPIAAFQHIS